MPGPEEPEQAPLSLDYVPEPEYPEYLVPSDVERRTLRRILSMEETMMMMSPDDNDDDDEEEEEQKAFEDDDEEDEEEEHTALTDSSVVLVNDHVPSAEDTEAFETN
ncbi:hypothetical protein Tco_0100558 [Tanacetum coccineum]